MNPATEILMIKGKDVFPKIYSNSPGQGGVFTQASPVDAVQLPMMLPDWGFKNVSTFSRYEHYDWVSKDDYEMVVSLKNLLPEDFDTQLTAWVTKEYEEAKAEGMYRMGPDFFDFAKKIRVHTETEVIKYIAPLIFDWQYKLLVIGMYRYKMGMLIDDRSGD